VPRAGDMSAKLMVLGVLASGSGTAAAVQKRLEDYWPSAGFETNAAHNSLPALAEAGCARVVEAGTRPIDHRYGITEQGWVLIRTWVADWPPATLLRDPVPTKARLAKLEELPEVIAMAEAQAERCTEESDRAHGKLTSRERVLAKAPPRTVDEEFGALVIVAQLEDEALAWLDLSVRKGKYAKRMQEIYDRFSGEAGDEGS
jgi:DNA-binding PadR family transcriptional regulator